MLVRDGALAAAANGRAFADLFGDLRAANHVNTYAAASFWWTLGGDNYQPFALCCRRMPDPFVFSNMLTGRLDPVSS